MTSNVTVTSTASAIMDTTCIRTYYSKSGTSASGYVNAYKYPRGWTWSQVAANSTYCKPTGLYYLSNRDAGTSPGITTGWNITSQAVTGSRAMTITNTSGAIKAGNQVKDGSAKVSASAVIVAAAVPPTGTGVTFSPGLRDHYRYNT